MLQELLSLMPDQADAAPMLTWVAYALIAAGAVLCILGSRLNRSLITLGMLAVGAWIAMHLPAWMGWNIDGMGPAVGAALVCGLLGFLLYRLWTGVGLGIILALWAVAGCWLALHGNYTWTWPDLSQMTGTQPIQALWEQVPEDLRRIVPFAAGASFMSGLAIALLWPIAATKWMHAIIGTTLLAAGFMITLYLRQSPMLDKLPQGRWTQIGILAGMILVSFCIQSLLGPKRASKKPAPPTEDEDSVPDIG